MGRIATFDFKNRYALTAEGTNRFVAGNETPVVANGTIEQGAIEGANQDAIHGSMQLVLVQRQAEMMQKALSVFNNEFDKTAAENLSRV